MKQPASRFLDLAILEAKKSTYKVKVGCVIFDKNILISKGHNVVNRSAKNLHPKYVKWKYSIHAEVNTILHSKTNLKGTSLLVIRINNDDQLRNSKPCKECMKYIDYTGIKEVFYSISKYPYVIKMKRKEWKNDF